MEHKIKIYPVGSGDCILVKLDNGKTIVFDCQIREDLKMDDKLFWFDVKTDLLKELSKDESGHPYVDLFISTHPHDDHCLGFEKNFFHGSPEDYNDDDKDKIIIGELWLTSLGFSNNIAESAKGIRREAKRRRDLYKDITFTGNYGNNLHVIGYDEDQTYDQRFWYTAGKSVTNVNGSALSWLTIFIHAPFKEDVSTAKNESDKNATSIVVQLSFKVSGKAEPVCKALFAGDAEHEIWQHIIDNNQYNANLEWNLFVAPHHCSWTFFNETSNKDEVKPSAENIMNKQIKETADVVASSNEIVKDNTNPPPAHEAKNKYIEYLKTKKNFRNTATYEKKNGVAQPIVYNITEYGKKIVVPSVNTGDSLVSHPAPRAGR